MVIGVELSRKLSAVIRQHRPLLLKHVDQMGSASLSEYCYQLMQPRGMASDRVKRVFRELLQNRGDADIAEQVVDQLGRCSRIGTSGHLGIAWHPENLHEYYMLCAGAEGHALSFAITLSGSGVPMSNLTLPGGLIWDNKKLSFYTQEENGVSLSGFNSGTMPGFTVGGLCRARKDSSYLRDRSNTTLPLSSTVVEPTRRNLIEEIRPLEKKLFATGILLSEQTRLINEHLWNSKIWPRGPRLINDKLEAVTAPILRSIIEESLQHNGSNHPIYRMLFDKSVRQAVLNRLQGRIHFHEGMQVRENFYQGSWATNSSGQLEYGTHLFWGLIYPRLPSSSEPPIYGKLISLRASDEALEPEILDRPDRDDFAKVIRQFIGNFQARPNRKPSENYIDKALSQAYRAAQIPFTPRAILQFLDPVPITDELCMKLVPGTFLNIQLLINEGIDVVGGVNQFDYCSGYRRALAPIYHEHDISIGVERLTRSSTEFLTCGPLFLSDGEWDPLESTCRHASLSIL